MREWRRRSGSVAAIALLPLRDGLCPALRVRLPVSSGGSGRRTQAPHARPLIGRSQRPRCPGGGDDSASSASGRAAGAPGRRRTMPSSQRGAAPPRRSPDHRTLADASSNRGQAAAQSPRARRSHRAALRWVEHPLLPADGDGRRTPALPSAGTGTGMRSIAVRRCALAAGFRAGDVVPFEHDLFRFARLVACAAPATPRRRGDHLSFGRCRAPGGAYADAAGYGPRAAAPAASPRTTQEQ